MPPPSAADIRAHRLALYEAGAVATRTGRTIDTFPIGFRADDAEVLAALIEREKARVTIETGLGLGLSTLAIVEGVRRVHDTPQHTAVDPHQRTWAEDAGRLTLERAGVADHVRVIEQDSALALPSLLAAGETFDLAFIDGGHRFEVAFLDTTHALRLVRPGALIVLDDAWMPSIQAVSDYFQTNMDCTREHMGDEGVDRRIHVLRTPSPAPDRAWDDFRQFRTNFKDQRGSSSRAV